ncbi:MAG: hypothetical protein FWB93_01520 [Oscillospiraceae bacterium]|nr:hypothetical protein [Oscillospiraceae bacterium]
MLHTPFGEIFVKLNDKSILYQAEKLKNIDMGSRGLPIFEVDGRYKIIIDISDMKTPLSLAVEFASTVKFHDSGIDSGERLSLKTWENGTLMFSIGTEDDIKGTDIEYLECGIKVIVDKNSLDKIAFGIAWRYIESKKEELYTWFAADPTI